MAVPRVGGVEEGVATVLMKNCEVAELGSAVRAIAIEPRTLSSPLRDSRGIGALVGRWFSLASKPPPWIMKFSMTR